MKRAVWGHLASNIATESSPEAIISRCKRSGIDTYLAHVYPMSGPFGGSDAVAFPSDVYQARTEDTLIRLLQAAKQEGIRAEPWLLPFDTSLLVGETAEGNAARTYQSATTEDNPKHGKVLCATWPQNRQRGVVKLKDLIETIGSDLPGVHLDGIRYVDTLQSIKNPCVCDACRAKYHELLGQEVVTAADLQKPGLMYKFIQFRCQCIRSLVEELRDIANRAGIGLSMAARADYAQWALPEGQDWPAWASDGLVDCVYLMNYFVDRETHRQHIVRNVAIAKGQTDTPIVDGLGKNSSFGDLDIENLIEFANDGVKAGADGLSVFHYNAMTHDDFEAVRLLG